MAKKRANTGVPTKWELTERKFGESIKENLDILIGHRGSPLERAVTFQDLLDTNVLSLAGNISGSTAGGDPANDFVTTPDPSPEVQPPPAPTSLQASGAFQNIILTWNMQGYVGHSHFEIHRHTSDSISDATLIAQVSGFTKIYSDAVGSNQTFYYWVRAVNILDELGPFNSSTGTQGVTQPDVAHIIDLLEDQITSTELASSLATPIGQIDTINALTQSLETYTGYISSYTGQSLIDRIGGLDTSVGTINSSITSINSSIASLNTATSNLQTSLSDLSANTADVYISASAPTGTIAENSRWYDTSDNNTLHIYFDSDGDGDNEWTSIEDPRIADNESAISTLNAEVFNSDNSSRLALASALTATNATVTNINGNVNSLTTSVTALNGAVFDANSDVKLASVSTVDSLTSDVQAIYDGTENPSLIKTIQTDITRLDAEVFDENGDSLLATATALTNLTNTVTSQGNSISTAQGQISTLDAAVFDADDTVKLASATTVEGLSNTVTSQGNSISAAQGQINTLNATVFDENNDLQLATGAALASLSNTVTSQGNSISSAQADISTLEGAVFDSNNDVKLATTAALNALTSDVEAIYDGTDNPSVVKTIQTNVTALQGAVFDANNDVKLATTSALDGLTSEVEAIYDGTENPSLVKTLQTQVTSLNGAVFDANNNVQLATGSALESLTNDVEAIYDGDNPSVVKTVQSNVTSLQAAVFDSDDNVQLASASAVSLLNNEIYGTENPTSATSSRIDALNTTITDETTGLGAVSSAVGTLNSEVFPNGTGSASRIDGLETAVFDANNNVKLASAAAVDVLETEVFGTGGASASRIDGLYAEVFDENGSRLATASALETLNTQVNGSGAISDKVDNIAASMFVDGDTDGTLKLATSAALDTVTAEVFPDGVTSTSRLEQLSSAIWSGGDPDNAVIVASANAVDDLETEVFPNGAAQASSISTLQVTVNGEDGNGGLSGSIETLQEVVGDENGGLSSQYSVKLDNNGYIAGFGLSNTDNDGTPTSAFIVRADKFAIVNPAANNEQTNSPSSSANLTVPFTVVTSQTTLNGENVPAGVYMDTAFLKNGSITNAFIGDAAIDNAKISSLSADKITAGTISTSRLNIDNATLTAGPNGELQVDSINANAITAGAIAANVMIGTTVYADKLTGDVNVIQSFRDTQVQQFAGGANTGTYGGDLTFLEVTLAASTHTSTGHIPYAQVSGWFNSTSSKTYRIQMWMKDNSTALTTIGTPVTVQTGGFKSSAFIEFSGDVRTLVPQGNTLVSGTNTTTVSSSFYTASTSRTRVYVASAVGFSTSSSVSTRSSGAYQLVGETRFKATTNLYMPYSISGTRGIATTGTVDMKLVMTRFGSSGVADSDTGNSVDSIGEVSGMIIGMR